MKRRLHAISIEPNTVVGERTSCGAIKKTEKVKAVEHRVELGLP